MPSGRPYKKRETHLFLWNWRSMSGVQPALTFLVSAATIEAEQGSWWSLHKHCYYVVFRVGNFLCMSGNGIGTMSRTTASQRETLLDKKNKGGYSASTKCFFFLLRSHESFLSFLGHSKRGFGKVWPAPSPETWVERSDGG